MTSYFRRNAIAAANGGFTLVTYTKVAVRFLITSGLALSATLTVADSNNRPFNANFEAFVPAGETAIAGQGIATHLGTMNIEFLREFASPPSPFNPCVSFQYMIVTMTAANGDELWMNYAGGELCIDFFSSPSITFAGDVNLVGTGGTGRFANSTGNYRLLWNGEITASGVMNYGEISGAIGY